MSVVGESWPKWLNELRQAKGTLNAEILASWEEWLRSGSKTLQSSVFEPSIRTLFAQLVSGGSDRNTEEQMTSVSAEAIEKMAKRLDELETTVARLKDRSERGEVQLDSRHKINRGPSVRRDA